MKLLHALLLAPLSMGAAGCTTFRVTEPGQTATEQLLVSTAVDHAVAQVDPQLAPGTRVFVDAQFYDAAPSNQLPKYTVGALRQRMLHLGLVLVDDKKTAQAIVELRTGGQSIDHKTMLVGLPSIPIPVPFAGTISTPELALFSLDRQTGVAKLAVTPYWIANGQPAGNGGGGNDYGMSRRVKYSILFISWSDDDLQPEYPR